MVEYIRSRQGAALSKEMLRRIVDGCKQNKKVLVIVPEQMSLNMELALSRELDVLWNVQVLSPTRLVHSVRAQSPGASVTMLGDSGRAMALRRVMQELGPSLLSYKRGGEGFISQMAELILELKAGEVEPTALRLAADGLDGGLIRDKLYDIAAIYDGYNALLQGKYADGDDAIDLFCQHAEQSALLQDATVFVDGFDAMPHKTIRLVFALVCACKDVSISFRLVKPGTAADERLFEPVYRAYEALHQMVRGANIPFQITDLPNENSKNAAFAHLEHNLYSTKPRAFEQEAGSIALASARDPHIEAERAAGFCFVQANKNKLRFDEVAVLCPSLAQYGQTLKNAFARRGISAFVDDSISCAFHPAGRYVLYALEAVQRGFGQREMIRLIKSGYCGLTQTQTNEMEILILEKGLKGSLFERLNDATPAQTAMLQTLMRPLLRLQTSVAGAGKTVKQLCRAVFLFMEESGLKSQLNKAIRRHSLNEEHNEADRCAQVWNTLVQVLDEACALCGENAITLKAFVAMLRSGLEGSQLQGIPQGSDEVYIGVLSRFKPKENLKLLVVVGVNEEQIPSSLSDTGLLRQEERDLVVRVGKESNIWMGSVAGRAALERFVIYTALTAPKEMLYLSYPLADATGKALRPSPLIARMQKLFPQLVLQGGLHGDALVFAGSVQTAVREFEKAVYEAAKGDALPPALSFLHAQLARHAPSALAGAKELITASHNFGRLPKDILRRLYGEGRASVSRTESFARCPFQHFVSYGLSPRQIQDTPMDALNRGIIYHDALRNFVSILAQSAQPPTQLDDAQAANYMDVAAQPFLENAARQSIMQGGMGKEILFEMRKTLRTAGKTICHQLRHSRFSPKGVEVGIGARGDGNTAIPIDLGNGEMAYLDGQIDRVDMYTDESGNNYVRVIDYKSSATGVELGEVFYGLRLQLFIYLGSILDEDNKKPAGVFYFRIDDPIVEEGDDVQAVPAKAIFKELRLSGLVLNDPAVIEAMAPREELTSILPVTPTKDGFSKLSPLLSAEDFDLLLRFTRHKFKALLRAISEGEIAAAPVQKVQNLVPCQYCQYRGICGIDPALSDFEGRRIDVEKSEVIGLMKEELEAHHA